MAALASQYRNTSTTGGMTLIKSERGCATSYLYRIRSTLFLSSVTQTNADTNETTEVPTSNS